MSSENTPEPIETIHVAGSNWGPPFLALGLALLIVGAYLWFVYAVAGGIIALAALRAWFGQAEDEIDDLPRVQQAATDVVEPVTR